MTAAGAEHDAGEASPASDPASGARAPRSRRAARRSIALFAGAFLLLTVLTQLGGLAIGAAAAGARHSLRRRWLAFASAYAVLMLAVAPLSASISGRVALPCGITGDTPLRPATRLTCVLGRHYVRPELRAELRQLAQHMDARVPGTMTYYLDAGFPLFDWAPLIPHLSHRDGRKVDLAFHYPSGRPPSPLGYWVYEGPRPGEPAPCRGRRSWLRWDFDWLQPLLAEPWDAETTSAAIRWLARPGGPATKLLLEPHLTQRLGLASPKVRFQGCGAARHDDHLHVEIGSAR